MVQLCRTTMVLIAFTLVMVAGVVSAAEQPSIVSRAEWKAKPAVETLLKRHTPREIIIHHTSVRQQPKISLERKMRGLQGYSQRSSKRRRRNKPAWGDLPYHFYIGVSGRTAQGLDINFAGDTNTKYNTLDRIQIVLEGHFDEEKPNSNQLAAMTALVAWLTARYNIPANKIAGHNDHASTDCPGENLKKHLPALRKQMDAIQSRSRGSTAD